MGPEAKERGVGVGWGVGCGVWGLGCGDYEA